MVIILLIILVFCFMLTVQCSICFVSAVRCAWSVSYSSTQVCGLKGASVVLPWTNHYSWMGHCVGGEWNKEKRGTVREVSNANKYPACSLKIGSLADHHAGVYHFRFYTALHTSWTTGKYGVTLSINGKYN